VTADQVARHEAGHAVAAVLLGIPVLLIDVIGDAKSLGFVRHAGERITGPDMARKRMVLTLCGPIESAESWDDVPSWPLETHRSTDERNLSVLADYLGLNGAGYRAVFLEALKLTLTDEYRRLYTAITGCLDYTPRIGPELLDELQVIAGRRRSR
jgi:hypothetical protein